MLALAIEISWLFAFTGSFGFIILPYFHKKYRKEGIKFISELPTSGNIYHLLYVVGSLISAGSLVLMSLNITRILGNFTIGSLFLVIAGIAAATLIFFRFDKHYKKHYAIAFIYFVSTTLAAGFIGIQFIGINSIFALCSIIFFLVSTGIMIYFSRHKRNVEIEIGHILTSYFWLFSFSLL